MFPPSQGISLNIEALSGICGYVQEVGTRNLSTIADCEQQLDIYCLLGCCLLPSNHRELPQELRRWPVDRLPRDLAAG